MSDDRGRRWTGDPYRRRYDDDAEAGRERWGTDTWRAEHASQEHGTRGGYAGAGSAGVDGRDGRRGRRGQEAWRPDRGGVFDDPRPGVYRSGSADEPAYEPQRGAQARRDVSRGPGYSDDFYREPMRGLSRDRYSDPAQGRLTDEWGTSRSAGSRWQPDRPAERLAYGYTPDEREPDRPGLLRELGHRIGEAFHEAFGGADRRRQGPKGYRRSDERIREQVCENLAYSHGVDIRNVSVDVRDGVVILTGIVENRADKFEIEEIADNVFGVTDVDNRLKLDRRPTAIGY